MRAHHNLSWVTALLLFALSAPMARAQQQDQTQQPTQSPVQSAPPIPAYHSPLASIADNGDADANADPQKLGPDTRSLAGAQDLSLGVPPLTQSYWEPRFNLTTTGDSNPLIPSATGSNGWTTWTSVMAGIDFHRTSGDSDLTLNYTGGGMISNDGSASNSTLQQFGFNDKISWRRSSLTIIDQLNYVPDMTIGYGGLSGLTLPGGGSLGLQQGFIPGQSILTPMGEQLTNSFVTQDDTYLTARSSLTFVGGYSLLHYYGDNLLDMGDATFQGGYNYQMSRQDTFAVLYRFSAYRYSNFGQSINDNMVQLSYGRRVTGKLAFKVAAGPELSFFETPIAPTTSSTGGTGSTGTGSAGSSTTSSSRQIYWSLNSSLTYQLQRTGLVLSYNHGLGGGSGVLAGAVTDTVTGTVNRQMSRTVSGGVNLGFSRSTGLSISGTTPSSQTYNYWFGGVNFTRPWSRTWNLTLSYQMQYQGSNSAFCIGPTCGTSIMRNMITLGLAWHARPLAF